MHGDGLDGGFVAADRCTQVLIGFLQPFVSCRVSDADVIINPSIHLYQSFVPSIHVVCVIVCS